MRAQSRTVVVNVVATLLVGLDVSGLLDRARQARISDLLPFVVAVLVSLLALRPRVSRYGWFLSAAGVLGMWVLSYLSYWESPLMTGLAAGLIGSGVVAAFVSSPPSRVPVALAFVGGLALGLVDIGPGPSAGLVFPSGLALLLLLAGFQSFSGSRLDWKDIAGIVDGTAVRTSGYLPGPHDIALTPDDLPRYGLRRGDAVTGVGRERSRTLVRVDTVNGLAPPSMDRPDFDKLQAAAPTQRLSLQSGSVIARVVDLVMPIGKGQRALIVAPPRAGATTTLRAIGDALPSGCHRMLVLVDQRPEDVAEIRRASTGGEVIASTVDMTPTSHVELASLALDRARRLVELGHDVVVLLDSVTRLGRAYQATSGRLDRLDAPAVTALRQFLGAAQAIENGGSLTIVATVSTGSPIEAAILDELKDTANASLWLGPDSTVDVAASGTRQALLSPSEQAAAARLRELLPTMDPAAALDQVSSLA